MTFFGKDTQDDPRSLRKRGRSLHKRFHRVGFIFINLSILQTAGALSRQWLSTTVVKRQAMPAPFRPTTEKKNDKEEDPYLPSSESSLAARFLHPQPELHRSSLLCGGDTGSVRLPAWGWWAVGTETTRRQGKDERCGRRERSERNKRLKPRSTSSEI